MSRRLVLAAVVLVLAAFVTASGFLFLWPATDHLTPADAVVVLGGNGPREAKGIQLAERHLAPVLVFSLPDPIQEPACHPSADHDVAVLDAQQQAVVRLAAAGEKILCFVPSPISTQGESREVARLATQHGWHRILLVVSRPQATRARLRLRRCYAGQFEVATVSIKLLQRLGSAVYEWGALAKALLWQRSC